MELFRLPVRGCVSHHSFAQFHLFLYDYLCVAVSPITLFSTVPFVSLWLPVRGCVSHHSILNSSICFFMTTCAWLCLPSVYSQQFHLFLYDYLCMAVSPINSSSIWETTCAWLCVPSGILNSSICFFTDYLWDGILTQSAQVFWTVPFVSLRLPVRDCVSHHSILTVPFVSLRIEWWETQLILHSSICSLKETNVNCVRITRFWTVPFVSLRLPVRDCVSHLSILYSSICFFKTTCAWLCLPSLYSEQFHLFL